jgi:protein TonB
MHGLSRVEQSEEIADWTVEIDRTGPHAFLSLIPIAVPVERSVYGARRANWALISFILAAHAALLAALVMFDVIPTSKPKADPLEVTLIDLKVEPPKQIPIEPVEKLPPAERVKPPLTSPVQLVERPLAPVQVTPVVLPKALPQPPVTAPPAPTGPVNVGDLSSKMVKLVAPRYPVESRRRKEQGTVYLLVMLDTDGAVADLRVTRSSGHERLDRAALDAVRKWRWSPTIRNGEAVPVQGTVDIPFILTA